jgi:nitrogen fixation protein NifU and related proteins
MSDVLYREIILESWKNPQNYGEMKKPDVSADEANPLCGDKIRVMAKVSKGKISDVFFISEGCAISTASASLMTQLVKGMKVSDFKKMKAETFLKKFELDNSPARIKCALLGFSTLQKALKTNIP